MRTTLRNGCLLAAGGIAATVLLTHPAPAATVPDPEVTVQFGATGTTAPAVAEDQIYHADHALSPAQDASAPLTMHPGGGIRFHVDGFHQPVIYRLHPDETIAEAYAALDNRAKETLTVNALNPSQGGTCVPAADAPCTGRMTNGPIVAPHRAPTDLLAQVDRPFGFQFLSPKSPDALGLFVSRDEDPIQTTIGQATDYILLCNIAAHYQNFHMHGVLHTVKP